MKKLSNLAFLGIIFFTAACGSKSGDTKKTEAVSADSTGNDKIKTVSITSLAPQLFNNYIDIQGRVDADENVAINAEMAGTVSKVHVQLGEEVTPGQVLAELDAKVIQQGIAELQSALELATTMFERQKNLWEQKIGTEVQFLSSKNQKESMDKRLASLQQQLEMTKIKSPIKGIVDAIDIKLGQATMPGLPAIRVVNLSSLQVKGEVAESYLAKVKKGNDVEIILPDMQDTLKTKISYAAKVIAPLNRTFLVTVNLDGAKDYHPNMIAIMKIVDYSNPKAFVVQMNMVQRSEEGDFVFIAQNNKAKKARVKTGRVYNGTAEILQGLKEGDKLITKGFQELNEGETVKF